MDDGTGLARLLAGAEAMADRPVERWNPAHCGDSRMVIRADGSWTHEGAPIRRAGLVKLFASILRREADGSYVLVTPGERLAIAVEDAPFVAVEVATEGAGEGRRLAFRLNTGEAVVAGPEHGLTLRGGRPYLHVRRGLEARVERAAYYELAEWALAEDGRGLWSDGAYFALV